MYIGDIDGDGGKDYVFLNYNKSDRLYDNCFSILYNRNGSLQRIPFEEYGRKKPIVLVQDIDLDGKDECLTKLANKIKSANGNGVVDLEITYSLIGIGGGFFQITTRGMGVKLKNN